MYQGYILISGLLGFLFVITLVRSNYLRKKDLTLLKEIKNAKQALTKSIFYHAGTEIPNYRLFGQKMLKVDKKYAVYHISLLKIGRSEIFDSITGNEEELSELFSSIANATKPFALALKDAGFIVMAYVSHGQKIDHDAARQKQKEILDLLPKTAKVNGRNIHVDYAISSLSLTGDSAIYGIETVERRLKFAMKYALENEDGLFYHDEKLYRAEMFKKHVLRDLTNSIAGRQKKDFYVVFQPIFKQTDLENPVRFEALVRWRNSNNVGPSTFIPLLKEQPKLQCDLTKIILNQVFSLLKVQIDAGETPLPVNVNISAEQVPSEILYKHISLLLVKVPEAAQYITFEIIETSKLICSKALTNAMSDYKDLGFTFAIDDFGQGVANFDWLHNSHFDVLKIDKDYIAKIVDEDSSSNLLDRVVELGLSCGLTIVIEGVENKVQLEYLSKFDELLIQGFYASKPVQASRYVSWRGKDSE